MGRKLNGGTSITTQDALGNPNGTQHYATPEQLAAMKSFICSFESLYTDLRPQLRAIEEQLLTTYAGLLIGNQCLDFQKQDGITEIEEAIMANAVERSLNDMLLADEMDGKVTINRRPIYVSCVSNFTNFLDLFRKTVRNLELGVPCVVLGRSNNAQQHSYRWALLLMELLNETGNIHPGMLTFISASLDDIKDVTQSCKDFTGNLYATCSRGLAEEIKKDYPNIVASTGGPNTLITTEWTQSVSEAIRMSATIESSGQCTALRHCVVPSSVGADLIQNMWKKVEQIPNARHAVEAGIFDGVFARHAGSAPPSNDSNYETNDERDVHFRVDEKPPPDNIQEYWRNVVVDFSRVDLVNNKEQIDNLAAWLNRNQPISLAVNAPRNVLFDLGRTFFEETGLVVYTLGSTDPLEAPPALSCQARPQEGEIFGEFPPRAELGKFTRYPVIVPSSTPSYDAKYTPDYLNRFNTSGPMSQVTGVLVNEVADGSIRGYCKVVLDYLRDATHENPKKGFGSSRTALWGLQRPPLLSKTCIRCKSETIWDDIAPIFLIFSATNANDQVELSLDPKCEQTISFFHKYGINVIQEHEMEFLERTKSYYNIIRPGRLTEFPLAGLFVSLYMPLGHIKSTKPADDEFVAKIRSSPKWLQMRS